jgi:hypothetical protein
MQPISWQTTHRDSEVLDSLVKNNLVKNDLLAQKCPLCEYEYIETLSLERISEILGWTPIQEAEKSTKKTLQEKLTLLSELDKYNRRI